MTKETPLSSKEITVGNITLGRSNEKLPYKVFPSKDVKEAFEKLKEEVLYFHNREAKREETNFYKLSKELLERIDKIVGSFE